MKKETNKKYPPALKWVETYKFSKSDIDILISSIFTLTKFTSTKNQNDLLFNQASLQELVHIWEIVVKLKKGQKIAYS